MRKQVTVHTVHCDWCGKSDELTAVPRAPRDWAVLRLGQTTEPMWDLCPSCLNLIIEFSAVFRNNYQTDAAGGALPKLTVEGQCKADELLLKYAPNALVKQDYDELAMFLRNIENSMDGDRALTNGVVHAIRKIVAKAPK